MLKLALYVELCDMEMSYTHAVQFSAHRNHMATCTLSMFSDWGVKYLI